MRHCVLAATLGHSNLRSITKYIHISAADIDTETLRIEEVRSARKFADFLPVPYREAANKGNTVRHSEVEKKGLND